MTNEEREEALAIMNVIIHMIEKQYDNDRVEKAVDTAIAALKAEPCVEANMFIYDAEKEAYIPLKYEPCEDSVSREAVLDIVDGYGICCDGNKSYENVVNGLVRATKAAIHNAIEKIPSVTPKQRTGKWIHHEDIIGLGGYYRCSCCGKSALYRRGAMKMINEKTAFCPNCGARMEGESE